jgi:hypothetical protein
MADRPSDAQHEDRALRIASSISVLVTVAIPAVLAAFGLVIGIATSTLPVVIAAVVVGILAGYGWVRRTRANAPK